MGSAKLDILLFDFLGKKEVDKLLRRLFPEALSGIMQIRNGRPWLPHQEPPGSLFNQSPDPLNHERNECQALALSTKRDSRMTTRVSSGVWRFS